ncbi:Hsp20/alpha crystallin family protein [Flagellimonas meridianipacifica]|uniref:HSP20 family protein n=1 Tax=Flagellimonas meridianipacifica TaxID=1080225 RepID=A0A2T0MI22_9FLAO|nr:Hsp20/alpha crystallin family protein [Allomuricauda pacifica]PRX57227.1 HSP20 family protein [Allomuricauda pacifica]
MSLVRFNRNRFPWNENLVDFFNRDTFINDDFFNLEKSLPAMNVKERQDDFEIELAAPGFDKKDFEITMKDDLLEVSAQKTKEETKEEEAYTRQEFNYNSFRRSMQLPSAVDQSKEVKATYKDGILKMHLLKMEEAKEKPKRIIEVV